MKMDWWKWELLIFLIILKTIWFYNSAFLSDERINDMHSLRIKFLYEQERHIFLIVHSHTIKHLMPRFNNSAFTMVSRWTLSSNFFCQNSMRLLGIYAYLQPECRCQKQPLTKIAVLYLRRKISGCPGTDLSAIR